MSISESDTDSDNIVELRISDMGHISLSDITAATIGPLDADIWSNGDSVDYCPTSVHRPWAEDTTEPTEQQQQQQQPKQQQSSTEYPNKIQTGGSLPAIHVMPQQISPETASKTLSVPPSYYESQLHTSDIEIESKRRRLDSTSVKHSETVSSYSYGALLQATSDPVPSDNKNNRYSHAHTPTVDADNVYKYNVLQKAMTDHVRPTMKDVVSKPSTIHYTPTPDLQQPTLTPYTALVQTFGTTQPTRTCYSPLLKTESPLEGTEVNSSYTWPPSTQSQTLSANVLQRSEVQIAYNETQSYTPMELPLTIPTIQPVNQTPPHTNIGQRLSKINTGTHKQVGPSLTSTPTGKTEFHPWVKTEHQSSAYQQTTSYQPMESYHQVAQSTSGKLVEDYYKNIPVFQQTEKYQPSAATHIPPITAGTNVQQPVSNYLQTTPVTKRSISFNDCKPHQGSPAYDSRFNDSLTNLLGSPPSDSPLLRNPFFGDLQDVLARDCKRETIPQSLFGREPVSEKDNIFKRERRLQERFEALKAKNPIDIHHLSSFYRYQSALIETERFRSLHESQYPTSYKQSLNQHYDSKIHSVMDRVEQSVLLLENANKENKPANQIAKPRPHLSKDSVYVMEEWYARNTDHPYPTSMAIEALAMAGNIGVEQVKKWFANKRNRSHNTRTLTEIAMKKRKLGQLASQS